MDLKKLLCKIGLVGALVLLGLVPTGHGQAIAQRSFTTNVVGADVGVDLTGTVVTQHKIIWRPVGTVSSCTVALDSSADGVTWSAGGVIAGQTCTSNGSVALTTANVNRVRINVTAFTGSGMVIVTYKGADGDGQTVSGTVSTTPPTGVSSTQVQGTTADGGTLVGNPVVICGLTTGEACEPILVDTDGTTQVNQTKIGGLAYALGQAAAASSAPVVLPSAQLPNTGQAVMTNSVPVTIASNQSAVSVTDSNFPATVDTNTGTSGANTIRVAPGTGNFTVVQPTGSNLHAQLDSGSTTVVTGNVTVVQPTGTNLHTVIDSGAVTNTPPANQSVNETQVAGSTLGAPSNYGTSPGAVTVPGVNAFITNTPAVTIPANSSVNVAQMNGATTSMNAGISDAGTQRVVQAQTTPADTTSNTSVPGPQSFCMIWNGATWDRCKGITGQTGLVAVGTVNSGTNPTDAFTQMFTQLNNVGNSQLTSSGVGYVFNNTNYDRARSGATANLPNLLGSTLVANVTVDPCASSAVVKSHAFANITTAITTALVPVSGSTNIFVCGINFDLASATSSTILFESGTGSACAVVTGCVSSGICSATYRNGAIAEQPYQLGYGAGTVFSTGAGNGLCALTTVGTSPNIAVDVTYVQQ
jgi:hypothetical protein